MERPPRKHNPLDCLVTKDDRGVNVFPNALVLMFETREEWEDFKKMVDDLWKN